MSKGQQFSLDNFKQNPDGSYSKFSVGQPREKFKSTSVNVCKPSKIDDNVIGADVSHIVNAKVLRKITLTLFGEPMPKQSVRSFISNDKIMHFQPKKLTDRTKDYIKQIKEQLPKDFIRFEERVHVTKMHFLFAPLKSFHKVKGKMDLIRQGEIFYKETRGDLDNLQKILYDSMNDIVFKDDSIIVSLDGVKKYFGIGGCVIVEMSGY